MEYITLFELQKKVKNLLDTSLDTSYWIVAEVSNIGVNNSGHCYLDLIEKEEKKKGLKAKAGAIIWANKYLMISDYFEKTTGGELTNGIRILVCVRVNYSEIYGLSLIVEDIDPVYTLGDMARQRMETINALKSDGVFDMNRELEMPLIFQRIAVLSSDKAAGYRDFIKELHDNSYNYSYNTELFASVMQGEAAEGSLIDALISVAQRAEEFDVVVIIRGGGSQSDLSCFDNYDLCSCVAQFPLPIITGIGHDKDVSVADMVAAVPLKTPTAVAGYLIDKSREFESILDNYLEGLSVFGNGIVFEQREHIDNLSLLLRSNSISRLEHTKLFLDYALKNVEFKSNRLINIEQQRIEHIKIRLKSVSERLLLQQKADIKSYEMVISASDPEKLLAKGYCILSANGKTITSDDDLKVGERIDIRMKNAVIESEIKRISRKIL